ERANRTHRVIRKQVLGFTNLPTAVIPGPIWLRIQPSQRCQPGAVPLLSIPVRLLMGARFHRSWLVAALFTSVPRAPCAEGAPSRVGRSASLQACHHLGFGSRPTAAPTLRC